jgi:hypothetical protein
MRALFLPTLAVALSGCIVVVDEPAHRDSAGADDTLPVDEPPTRDIDASPDEVDEDDDTPPSDTTPDEPPPDAPPDAPPDDTTPDEPPPEEPAPDEPLDSWGEGGATPASLGGSCVEWTDCAPHYADPNSGIDCDNGTCRCDVTGEWQTLCGSIDGYWSAADCFCFVGASNPPSAEPEPPEDAEEDVSCWWTWRESCEADRWVDTSYYEYVCYDDDDCGYEYVDDGYYEDGACTRRWIKRCTDGYDYWY